MKKSLLGSAAAVVLAFGASQSAQATPYAFVSTTFDNFQIALSGSAALQSGSISATTSQNYNNTNTGKTVTSTFGASDPGVGAAAPNAFGGPNVTYTAGSPAAVSSSSPAPIVESSLKGGDGAQAASSVGAISPFVSTISSAPPASNTSGDGSIGAVELGGFSPAPGTITGNSSQRENVYTVTTGASGGTVKFAFNVQAFVQAAVTQYGETASASTNNSITASCQSGACSALPPVTFAPGALQLAAAVGPTLQDLQHGNQTTFSFFQTTFSLLGNSVYNFSLASVLTATTSSVPEPASLAILGTSLLGFGVVARRRRKKS